MLADAHSRQNARSQRAVLGRVCRLLIFSVERCVDQDAAMLILKCSVPGC